MKKLLIVLFVFACANNVTQAQNTSINPQALAGWWRMKMDINMDGKVAGEGNDDPLTSCLLQIVPNADGSFNGNFTQCGYERWVTGNLYDGKVMNAVMYGNPPPSCCNSDKYVYSGQIVDDCTIKGTYYAPSCMMYGDYTWEKIKEIEGVTVGKGNVITTSSGAESYGKSCNGATNQAPMAYSNRILTEEERAVENFTIADDVRITGGMFGKIMPEAPATYNREENNKPLYADNTPVYSDNAPAYADNMPAYAEVTPPKSARYDMMNTPAKVNMAVRPNEIDSDGDGVVDAQDECPNTFGQIVNMGCPVATKAVAQAFSVATKTASKTAAAPKFEVTDAGKLNPNAPKPLVADAGKKVVENGVTYHIVGSGQTMYAISRLYNIPVVRLAEINKKMSERLCAGETLRVSE